MLRPVILAAGRGRRLAPVTGGIPKQFWRPHGRHSLLDETLRRLRPLAPVERMVVVVDHTQRAFVDAPASSCAGAQVLLQPTDRGTAAGVLFALLSVLHADGEAEILITPSDHGLRRPALFRGLVQRALAHLHCHPERVVLFGVEPTGVDLDYGWITPAPGRRASFRPVAAFVEKPPEAEARRLRTRGALWNTMVTVTRARALLEAYRRQLPDLTARLTAAVQAPARDREAALARTYAALSPVDFSHDLLTGARDLWTTALPAAVAWSDLGTPDRLRAWMAPRSAGARRTAA